MPDALQSPWAVAHSQAILSMGFPRQEYWSGLSLPSPRETPDPEIKPMSPALDSLPLSHLGSPQLPCCSSDIQRTLLSQEPYTFSSFCLEWSSLRQTWSCAYTWYRWYHLSSRYFYVLLLCFLQVTWSERPPFLEEATYSITAPSPTFLYPCIFLYFSS